MDRFDALVIGHGLPELFAALDLAEVGLRVAVLPGAEDLPEAAERDPDGAIAGAMQRLATPLPHAPEPRAGSTQGGTAGGDLGTGSDSAAPREESGLALARAPYRPPLLRDRAGQWAPQADPSVFGIPAMPLSVSAMRLLGTGSALRAYLDRLTPLLTIGKTRSFGRLIRNRIGPAALERLCEPLLRERYGVAAADIDTALAAPGLNEALSRTGSLTSAALAYSERYVARETGVRPAAGWPAAQRSALRRLMNFDASVFDTGAASVEAAADGAWVATLGEDGARIVARALVVGLPRAVGPEQPAGESVLPGGAMALAAAASRGGTRVYVDIDIQEAAGIDPGEDAVGALGEWSLRIRRQGPGVFRLRALSRTRAGAEEAQETASKPVEELLALLAGTGIQPVPGARPVVGRLAAPFATIAAREDAAASLERWQQEHPTLLVLGRALHGDDLAAAVAAGHHGAVELRRRLLGLSE